MNIFAITTRGLETISAAEMALLPGMRITETAYRRIAADYDGSLPALLNLRTVAAVFITLDHWEQLSHQRVGLEQIREWSGMLDLPQAVEAVSQARPLQTAPNYSVTVNYVGKRNYNADEIKDIIAEVIARRYGWRYGEENETEINLRAFIEHEHAYLGLRLSAHPLHSRLYKQAHITASLKPSVAAGMLFLADLWPTALTLDPFCGAGTISIEAALTGARALGGDNDWTALAAAVTNVQAAANVRAAPAPVTLSLLDARRLPLPDRSVDFVVSNFPWGRQLHLNESLYMLYRDACTEIERVLVPNGRAVLLTSLPEHVQFSRLRLDQKLEISLFGQTPQILIFQ
jgi:tRNA (guanine6-N2)-methyltransferase